jgi:hypothetical protein
MASPFMRCAHCILRGVRMPFSNDSLRSTYFFVTAKKSRQKNPLEGNALHPMIL